MEIMVTGLHYYVEDVAQFLASLTVGEVFTLIHEEYNIVDRNAVAVVQRSNMVGHVNRDEAGELLKLMAGKRLCHARFTGEHDGDTCLYLEVEPMVECEGKLSTETLLPPSAIGFEEPPFVLPVEYAIESAMDRVRAAVTFLDTCHVRGAAFHGVLDELPAHLEALLDVCGLSLSLECNLCRKELRALLKRLKRMGDEARDVVIPYMNRQNELEAAMRDKAKAGSCKPRWTSCRPCVSASTTCMERYLRPCPSTPRRGSRRRTCRGVWRRGSRAVPLALPACQPTTWRRWPTSSTTTLYPYVISTSSTCTSSRMPCSERAAQAVRPSSTTRTSWVTTSPREG